MYTLVIIYLGYKSAAMATIPRIGNLQRCQQAQTELYSQIGKLESVKTACIGGGILDAP